MIINDLLDESGTSSRIPLYVALLTLSAPVLFSLSVPFHHSLVSLVYILVFLQLFLSNRAFKKITLSLPLLAWFVLILYHLVNATIKCVPDVGFSDYLHGFKCFAAISIFCYFFMVDFAKTLRWLIFFSIAGIIIYLIKAGFVMRGEDKAEGGISAVTFGKMAYMTCIYVIYMGIKHKKAWTYVLRNLVIPFAVILYAQTRTALGVVLINTIGFYYSIILQAQFKFKNVLSLCLVGLVAFFAMTWIINNTGLGERITNDDFAESYERKDIQTGTVFDNIAGERLIYYVTGFYIFQNNQITGIGWENYQNFTGGKYPMHVEYMKHLAEGGIIGFALFVLFLLLLAQEINKSRINKNIKVLLTFTYLSNLFLLLYSCTCKQEYSVIIYSIIIAVSNMKEFETSHDNDYII